MGEGHVADKCREGVLLCCAHAVYFWVQDPSIGRGDINRHMFANTSSDSINQLAHGDTSVSPSSYSSFLGGSRINLTNTVIRGMKVV